MADVSSACDVVSSRFEACPPERALRTLCAFVSRREREEDSFKAGQNASLNQKVVGGGGETLDGHGSGGSHVVGSAGQLRLVRDSLVAQLGGMNSEVCIRAFQQAKETPERKQTSLSAGRGVNAVDQNQNPTFELEMGTKTVAGLVAERIAEKRKRKKDKKDKKKKTKKKRKKDE